MRLLTWNVNGLRPFLKRKGQQLPAALEALDADVVCFQETKLPKPELDSYLAIADGWESFFSCTHGKTGYSGVATFCRSSLIPQAAEEGVSGVLQPGQDCILPEILAKYSRQELKELDSEGRCVITDHGAFVLFNVYGPAIAGDDKAEARFAFKLAFYEVLHMRMAALHAQGRCVVLVGDLNISPAPVDSCCSGSGENLEEFKRRRDRVWLNSLLGSQGPMVDTFRLFHPDRAEAYTCWNQASGARVNNYGSRIDHILCTSALRPGLEGCNIEPAWQGSDHAPVWADLGPSIALCSCQQLPALASRNLFTGRQQSMRGFLRKASSGEQPAQAAQSQPAAAQPAAKPLVPVNGAPAPFKAAAAPQAGKKRKAAGSGGQQSMRSFLPRPAPTAPAAQPLAGSAETAAASAASAGRSAGPVPADAGPCTNTAANSGAAIAHPVQAASQQHLMQQHAPSEASRQLSQAPSASTSAAGSQASQQGGSEQGSKEDAASAWKRIHQLMAPPKCSGHGEPCVIRTTKKKGANQGRLFYCCARPDGKPPEGRCDDFIWAARRTIRGQP